MASLMPNGRQQYFDSNGDPLIGGKVYTYAAGTVDTPKATYTTAAGDEDNTNPVILNARGEAAIFWDGSYFVEVKDANGVLIYSVDNYTPMSGVLSAPSGSDKIGHIASGAGAVATTVQEKLRESVCVKDFGGVAGMDCAAALLQAGDATTGSVLIPAGSWTATATTAVSERILALLNRLRCDGELTINLAGSTHAYTGQVVVNSPDAQRIQVLGAPTILTTATSQVSVSGAAKDYSVVIGVTSSAGVAVGDYAMVRVNVTGTGVYYAHAGVWRITAIDSGGANRLTLKNTHHGAAFPTNTLTGGTVVILKTVLQFTGCDGFRFEGGQPLGLLDQMAIVGDYDLAAATGTTGAHGIIGVSPVITGGGSSNATFNTEAQVILGANVGISAFGEQGIAISGRGSLVGNFVASCSNRKRGLYCDGASFRTKFAIASGNGEDGFIADSTGYLQCALSIAAGNGLNGFWSTNNSLIAASSSISSGNLTNGFESRGDGRLAADSCLSYRNGAYGFNASDGGMLDADSATADANTSDGFYFSRGSVIDANNATSKNNGGWGVNGELAECNFSGSGTFTGNTSGTFNTGALGVRGYTNSSKFPFLWDTTIGSTGAASLRAGFDFDSYVDFVSTSVGDLAIKNNGTNSFIAKAQGAFYPVQDNAAAQTLGRASERWSVVYAGTGAINTSDEREKQQIKPIDDAALRAWAKVEYCQFKFNDAVALKGDGARWHFGVIAQRVKEAFESEGLDAFAYGVLCYDEWEAEVEQVRDHEGNPTGETVTTLLAGNRYGIRYEEALVLECAYLRSKLPS